MPNKVLVVEDENIMVKLLENALTQNGYEVSVVSNGQEGLQAVRENKPDLIISDVMMPVMDGFTFCRELKADETMADIPVLILTDKSQMEDSFGALGVDDFIPKPFEPEALLLKVARLLEDFMTSAEIKERIIRENSEALHIPPEAYTRIVRGSFQHSGKDILDLGKVIESASYDGIKEIAHRLEGVYANFKLTDVSTRAHEINELAKSNGDIQKIKEDYVILKDAFENLKEIFNS